MTIAIARITVYLHGSRSLKDKRMALRRVKDRVKQKLNVAIAEVDNHGDQDVWQRGSLGVAVVAGDRAFASEALDETVRFVRGEIEVVHVEREVLTFAEVLAHNDWNTIAGRSE